MSRGGVPLRAAAEVLSNQPAGGCNWRLLLRVPGWPGARPGQFAMLSPGARAACERWDPLLPRPMAIYRERAYSAETEIEILYKVTGRGTALLAEARVDQSVGVVGPLGRSFPLPAAGEDALLVGGGTGIASLYALASLSVQRGPTAVFLGARAAEDLMGLDDFRAIPELRVEVATEDGGAGERGLVTQPFERALASSPRAAVYACGPTPMMRAVAESAAKAGQRCFVSLENSMACGFGVCLGCAVPQRDGVFSLVCREGPVFAADAVDWSGLA